MKITSVNNELIKETAKLLQKKYRDENNLFLIEGAKGIQEAIKNNVEIIRIFTTIEDYKCDFAEVIYVTEPVISKITDTKTAPKLVAVAKQLKVNINDLKNAKRLILLENIKDAGNLGTIIRTASAFNIEGIILYGDTVDLYNPKCVRSAVGNLWKTKILTNISYKDLEDNFSDFEKVATLPKSENTVWLNDYLPSEKTLIMFGSEADGLSKELINFATKNVTIEMSNNVESLNLAVSASLIMYKIRN